LLQWRPIFQKETPAFVLILLSPQLLLSSNTGTEQAVHGGALPEAMLALLLKKKMLGLARLREIILLECGG